MVSKYSFDTGATLDEVSNNDAVGTGVTYGTDRFGNTSQALDVTLNSTHLNLYDSYDGFAAGTAGKISYSFWVNFKTITSTQQILLGKSADAGCSGNDRQFLFRLNTTAQFEITSYSSVSAGNFAVLAANNVTCTTGQWYHVVLTYDAALTGNSKYQIYVNNNLQPLTQTSVFGAAIGSGFIDATACIGVGAYLKSDGTICVNTQRLDAYFDDLYIYNKPLTGTEVSTLYNAPNTTVGLNDVLGKTNGVVYPNPATSHLTIKTDEEIKSISIYNSLGTLVQTEKTNSFSVEQLPAGIYISQIKTDKGTSAIRFIKE
ncbi:MAG: T9SS type A sorting domain-containing protein [Bacteroidetes bacterium]|nr:T9SS type A sorting domain-containing protein [Bacteroidota bacterium]